MKKNQIVLIIIGTLILIGFVSNFSCWLGKKEAGTEPEVFSPFLQSKVISNWQATAEGEVKEIEGQTITLSADGDILNITLTEDADIQSISYRENDRILEKKELADIKIGDKVTVYLKSKGDLAEGYSVIILSP